MQIRSLKLENAKSYQDATIRFTPGVNAIVGHNGAGKSTILEAIGLAVFDEIGYKIGEFVQDGKRTATVTATLESSLDGRLYDVVRRIGSSNLHYIVDPETGLRICEGKADTLAFLREHLGVDSTANLSALFRDAVGVPQGAFTAAFLDAPARRKGVFDPLLQVDDYRNAYDKLRPAVNLLSEQQQAVELTIARMSGQLEALPALEEAVQLRKAELTTASDTLDRTRTLLDETVGKRIAMEAVRDELNELRNDLKRVQDRQQANAKALLDAKQALADAEAASKLVAEHQSGHDQFVAAKQVERELDEKVRQRQRLENNRAACEKAIAVAEANLAQLRRELTAVDEAQKTMASLSDSVAKQQELEDRLARERQNDARYGALVMQMMSQRETVNRTSSAIAKLNEALAQTDQLEQRSSALRTEETHEKDQIEELRNENAMIETMAKTIKEQTAALEDVSTAICPVCEQPLSEEHRAEMIRRNNERLDELRSKYASIQSRIKESQTKAQERQRELGQVERQLRELPRASELESNKAELARAQESLDDLTKQQEELAGAGERIERLEAQLAELGEPKRDYEIAKSQVSRRETLSGSLQEVEHDLSGHRITLRELVQEMEQFASLDEEMDACSAIIERTEESYRTVLSNRRQALSVSDRIVEVEKADNDKAQLASQAESLQKRIEETALRFDEDAYRQTQENEQQHRAELGALEARIDMMRQQQESDVKAIAEMQRLQTEVAQAEAKSRLLSEQRSALETIRNLLRDAGPYVTKVLIRQVSDNAQQFFYEIMQDYSRHLSWTEDYGIVLEVDGHEREFSQLSGGEQMSAALAVRLALLRELSNIDIAFFDEPTANLDEVRREALAQQILDVKGFKQLFVISHDDTFEQSTQNLIRVERVDGVSVASAG